MSIPTREPMALKNMRVPVVLWREAAAIAAARGESVSELIRGYLREYVREHKSQ